VHRGGTKYKEIHKITQRATEVHREPQRGCTHAYNLSAKKAKDVNNLSPFGELKIKNLSPLPYPTTPVALQS
jgi:hypothetical protein